ncbi:nitrogen fixation protein FixH, partial [Paracoccus liaowanqingii]
MTRELTGRHVLAVTVGAFALIIGVNLVMAVNAVRSFPGLETRSAYISSQQFEAERVAQMALGWTAALSIDDGRSLLTLQDAEGQGVRPKALGLVLRRPTHQQADQHPRLQAEAAGRWHGQARLAPGNWNADLTAEA